MSAHTEREIDQSFRLKPFHILIKSNLNQINFCADNFNYEGGEMGDYSLPH